MTASDPNTSGEGETRVEPGGDANASLTPDAVLGQYRIIRLLGRGGMGEVYEVEHTTLGRRYALKLLPEDFADRPGALERFRREARVMANLEHANIVRVDEFGETEGRYWLRMELAEGVELEASGTSSHVISLGQLADAGGGKVPQELLLPILSQVLAGLSYAHEHGAVHRDLKPSNILLSESESSEGFAAKISDFGLVRLVGEEWVRSQAEISVRESMSLGERNTMRCETEGTSSRSLLGTYEYMSPEQKRGEEADARSDLYSFGLMCFRLLTGRNVGLRLPTQIDDSLASGWDRIVSELIDDDPADRPDSCPAVLQMFEDISADMQARAETRQREAVAQERARRAALAAEKRRIEERRKEREAREGARREEEHLAEEREPEAAEERTLLVKQQRRQAAPESVREPRHKPDWPKWAALSLLTAGLLAGVVAAALYLTQERTAAIRRRMTSPRAPSSVEPQPVRAGQVGQRVSSKATAPDTGTVPPRRPAQPAQPAAQTAKAERKSKPVPPPLPPEEAPKAAPATTSEPPSADMEPHMQLRVRNVSVRTLQFRLDGKLKVSSDRYKFQVNHVSGNLRRTYYVALKEEVGKTGFVVDRYEERITTVAHPTLRETKKDASILYLKSGDKTVGLTYKQETPYQEFRAELCQTDDYGRLLELAAFEVEIGADFGIGKNRYNVLDIDDEKQTVAIRRESDGKRFTIGESSVKADRETGRETVVPSPVGSHRMTVSDLRDAVRNGELTEARTIGFALLARTTDAKVRSEAEELLGQIHIAFVMSARGMPEKKKHTVARGDSIAVIARKYGTTVDLIQQANDLKNPNLLKVGDRLLVLNRPFEVAFSTARHVLVVTLDGRFFKRYAVGTGKHGRTPVGTFTISDKQKEPVWWRPDGRQVPYGDPENVLGSRWMALRATADTVPVRGYGIHGTWDESSVGRAESAGCIRLRNADVEELYTLLPVGTKVTIGQDASEALFERMKEMLQAGDTNAVIDELAAAYEAGTYDESTPHVLRGLISTLVNAGRVGEAEAKFIEAAGKDPELVRKALGAIYGHKFRSRWKTTKAVSCAAPW